MSTVGIDKEMIRDYILRQEEEDRRLDQLDFFRSKKSQKDAEEEGPTK